MKSFFFSWRGDGDNWPAGLLCDAAQQIFDAGTNTFSTFQADGLDQPVIVICWCPSECSLFLFIEIPRLNMTYELIPICVNFMSLFHIVSAVLTDTGRHQLGFGAFKLKVCDWTSKS